MVFIKHNDYLGVRIEILLPLFGLTLIGVVGGCLSAISLKYVRYVLVSVMAAVFVDFQFDLGLWGPSTTFIATFLILVIMGANAVMMGNAIILTIVTLTVIIPNDPIETDAPDAAIVASNPELPPILHIILDEHIGIAGMSEATPSQRDVKRRVMDFYRGNGFHVYRRAYSQYVNSDDSVSNMLNYETKDIRHAHFEEVNEPRILKQNRYFDRLRARGYQIKIFQNDYLDVCGSGRSSDAASCFTTYNWSRFPGLKHAPLPRTEKAWLITTFYLQLSGLYRKIRTIYQRLHRAVGLSFLPRWNWDVGGVGSLVIPQTADIIARDLSQNPGGFDYFVHFFMPHAPFVMDRDCQVKPAKAWRRGYNEQILCSLRILDKFVQALKSARSFQKAVIIVHGDHGYRINLGNTNGANVTQLTSTELISTFSTLWAIKVADGRGFVDDRIRSVQKMLPRFEKCRFALCDDNPDDEEVILQIPNGWTGSKMKTMSVDLFRER
ncbi:MAG: hypothetical protein GKS01_11505 [Alphaproteobacteria bacterium]|nr:hypothetical protein [Alphaproteobacteria bacterium]